MPSTVLYAEDTPVNKRDKVSAFLELMFFIKIVVAPVHICSFFISN